MEEEIDLLPYLQALFKRAKWIAAFALLCAIITFIAIFSSNRSYEATALVFVAENSAIFQFDPRIQEVTNREPLSVLPELAVSDIVLSQLIQQEALDEVTTLEKLRAMVQAQSGSDRSIVRLSVTAAEPAKAAEIANLWADIFVTQLNTILGIQDSGQYAFFENQLLQAEENLQTADNNLIAFQEINRTNTISNTLTFYNQEQTLYLSDKQNLTQLIQDAELLREQLIGQNSNISFTLADQLVGLTLQMEGFNSQTVTPLFFQFDSDVSLIGSTKNEQLEFLDRLIEFLQIKLSTVESRLSALEPEILSLQQEWQEAIVTHERLLADRLIASETYLSLARKVEEEKITTQDENRGLRLISQAVEPNEPRSRNTVLFTLAAGVIGLLLGLSIVFGITWWQQMKVNLTS
ncbi:MAG: hypothetical protein H6657_23825 [Ardenticatenaceae bacterium]|nr:hypothetical protein [Ardenticatenaceae bacterium]